MALILRRNPSRKKVDCESKTVNNEVRVFREYYLQILKAYFVVEKPVLVVVLLIGLQLSISIFAAFISKRSPTRKEAHPGTLKKKHAHGLVFEVLRYLFCHNRSNLA